MDEASVPEVASSARVLQDLGSSHDETKPVAARPTGELPFDEMPRCLLRITPWTREVKPPLRLQISVSREANVVVKETPLCSSIVRRR